ncbi:MAG: hypothetical protein IJR59_03900 [Firmicutes bacterium]|nr:hypothetical protein [Bacillota bacterium]
MEKTVLTRVKEAEDFLAAGNTENRDEYLKYLARWIGYIQHERFIHLVVTMFFGLFAMLTLMIIFMTGILTTIAALAILVITLGFYVRHYFILENKTQYLYDLYDKIEKM